MIEVEASPSSRALSERATSIWRRAQLVRSAPSWEGLPEARAVAEEVARDPENATWLIELLGDPSQLVVAYSLLTLELMGSHHLKDLPSELLTNRSTVTLVEGSFRNSMDLGGLARQIQKRANKAPA